MSEIDSFLVEQNIIACLLQKPSLIHDVSSKINKDYFSNDKDRKQNKALYMIFDYISRQKDEDDLEFDSLTILSVAQKFSALDKTLKRIFDSKEEFIQYIETLREAPIDPSNVGIHIEELKKVNITKDLSNKLEKYNKKLVKSFKEWEMNDIISKAESEILEVGNKYQATEECEYVEATENKVEKYKKKKVNKNSFVGLPLPFSKINKFTRGVLRKGSLTVVNAKTKVGKSLMLAQIAKFLAVDNGIPVLLAANEMSVEENELRVIKQMTGLPMIILENNLFNSSDEYITVEGKKYKTKKVRKTFYNAVEKLDEAPLYFNQIRNFTLNKLKDRAKYFKTRYGVKCVVFDYIKESTAKECYDMVLRMWLGRLTRCLKQDIGDRLRIPVVSASQANDNNVFVPNEGRDIFRYCTTFMVLRRLSNKERRGMEDYGLTVKNHRYGKQHNQYKEQWIGLNMEEKYLKFKETNM